MWPAKVEKGSRKLKSYVFTLKLGNALDNSLSFFTNIEHFFFQTVYLTSIGQHLDCTSSYNKKKNNLDGFTMELFNTIAINKTSYYTMKFPLYLGLLLVKDGHLKPRKEWSEICFDLGILLQLQVRLRDYNMVLSLGVLCNCGSWLFIFLKFALKLYLKSEYKHFLEPKLQILFLLCCLKQNDYIDAFGPESVTGKAGSDIQEGKLTWVAVTALQLCNDQQREVIKEYYGSEDPNHVNKVKEVFKELKIPQLYEVHESKVYNDLVKKIKALPNEGESKFFLNLLNKWYKRVL